MAEARESWGGDRRVAWCVALAVALGACRDAREEAGDSGVLVGLDASEAQSDALGGAEMPENPDEPDALAVPDDLNQADAVAAEDAVAEPPPERPGSLRAWLVGDPDDAAVTPGGPGLILMGGGEDVDKAFVWWAPRVAGGDVVVLRTSGSDGYNDYLFASFGAVDSVETLLVDTPALADDPWVAQRVASAEGVFIAGGDQATYAALWRDTALSRALAAAWERGAVVGGTSAGCAMLGQLAFVAAGGTIDSREALADPYDPRVTLEAGLLETAALRGVITDTHFRERDRMGRLVAFVARAWEDHLAAEPVGIGVDEATALVIDADGVGTVLGDGAVHVVSAGSKAERCEPGEALVYRGVTVQQLREGDEVRFPGARGAGARQRIVARGGALEPRRPY
jgi:cyanophycinase